MSTANLLLAVLAVASLAQAVSLVVLFWQGRRILQGLEETGGRLAHSLAPTVENLTRTTESLAETTAITSAQLRRVDRVVTGLTEKVAKARGMVDELMVPSAVKLVALTAAIGVVRRGIAAVRRGRG
jgi:ABC-type transporter Mla subunit MlaD